MLLELHCHTSEHSACSHVRAVEQVRQALDRGLDGLVVTDHHYLWPDEELEDLRRLSGAPRSFVLLSGQEVYSREFHDLLVYGADRAYPVRTRASTIRQDHPDAALAVAHPFRWGQSPPDDLLTHPLLDAVEVWNGQQTDGENELGIDAYRRLAVVGIAGSDAHFHGAAGSCPTRFDEPVHTIAELARSIRAGRCCPAD